MLKAGFVGLAVIFEGAGQLIVYGDFCETFDEMIW